MNETVQEARDAVKGVCSLELLRKIEQSFAEEGNRPIKICPHCGGGFHFVGRTILPDGELGLGFLAVCDNCGFNEKRRS
jgi:hypothetical protein